LPPKYQLLELAQKLNEEKPGHVIITDSKWGAEETAPLLEEQNINFLLSARKNAPSYLFEKLHQSLKLHEFDSLDSLGKNGPMTALSYQDDSKIMNMYSNYINGMFVNFNIIIELNQA